MDSDDAVGFSRKTMMDDLLLQDEDNRRRALELDSFIVEAPAGAGKTELLTQRYLRLLATVEAPEEIIAITFTNKAAGEMRSRIQESLALAASGVRPDAAHKRITYELATAALARSLELGWQLEVQTGRLRLTTIDALCASLARQLPLLSRFGAQPAIADEPQAHYEEAARRALDHLEGEGEHTDAVATALAYLDNDASRLVALLAQMLARREQWREIAELDDPEAALSDTLGAMVSEELARIATRLDVFRQSQLMPLARFAAANLGGGMLENWNDNLHPSLDELPRWRALSDLLLTKEGEARKIVNKNNGFPAGKEFKAQKDAMLEILAGLSADTVGALQRVRQLPTADHDNDAVVQAFARLMKLAAAELWLVFRERGEVDFGELSARAIAALGDELAPSEFGLRLDYRIRHLLVDEFQDTSPTQIDLLTRLTAGWQPGDGRTLFAVGDPMQSVYRFRKADVGLFLHVAKSGIGAVKLNSLRLSRNNRSCPEVVDWINQHFPTVFPAADDTLRGEICYRPFVATRASRADAGVAIHPVIIAKNTDGNDGTAEEARQIMTLIAAEWQDDPTRQIAVLVRARNHLQELVLAIRRERRDWRFSAVEIEPLMGRQAIQDLISLTRALHHRADRLHWLAVLRAPWCGLRLADLHVLAGDDHASTIWTLIQDTQRVARMSADGQQRLAHLRMVFDEALAGQGRQRRRRWVEDVWKKLGGPLCLENPAEQIDVAAFFNRLDALDAAGRFVLDTLEHDMARLYAAPDAEADGRLQLMTIHKSKGLEFDTVILPALHRESSGRETPLLAWDSFALADGERLLAAPLNRRRQAKSDGPTVYDFLQTMERERSRNEDVRVLYVAATRAVRRLHLFGVAQQDEAGALSAPRALSSLGRLWPALAMEFERVATEQPTVDMPTDGNRLADFVPSLVRLATPAANPDWQAPAQPTALPLHEETTDALAAAVGTLAHACMEQMVVEPESWTETRLRNLYPNLERWLGSRGWAAPESRAGAQRVADMLVATLQSEAGRWVLARRDDAASELALAKIGAGETAMIRVVDRSFVEQGVRWLIDYKTADLGAADDERLIQHAERYRGQLDEYATLFTADDFPLRRGILYLAYGRFIELA